MHGSGSLPICPRERETAGNRVLAATVARTTSTSGNFATGLKKCRPISRDGSARHGARSSSGMLDVFVARIAPAFMRGSSCRYSACLASRSSKIASMMKSAAAAPLPSTSAASRSRVACNASGLRTFFSNSFAARCQRRLDVAQFAILQRDVIAFECAPRGDIAAHDARADDVHVSLRVAGGFAPAGLLEALLQEIDPDEVAGRRCLHQLAERLGLGVVGRIVGGAMALPQVDHRVRRRVMLRFARPATVARMRFAISGRIGPRCSSLSSRPLDPGVSGPGPAGALHRAAGRPARPCRPARSSPPSPAAAAGPSASAASPG